MCLEGAKLTKEKPRTVWKVLMYHDGALKSIYRDYYTWEIGKKHKAQGTISIKNGMLGDGVFHTYGCVEDAITDFVSKCYAKYFSKDSKVVLGVFTIPDEAVVYEGCYGSKSVKSYGCSELFLERVIDTISFHERQTIWGHGFLFDKSDEWLSEMSANIRKRVQEAEEGGSLNPDLFRLKECATAIDNYLKWRKEKKEGYYVSNG